MSCASLPSQMATHGCAKGLEKELHNRLIVLDAFVAEVGCHHACFLLVGNNAGNILFLDAGNAWDAWDGFWARRRRRRDSILEAETPPIRVMGGQNGEHVTVTEILLIFGMGDIWIFSDMVLE